MPIYSYALAPQWNMPDGSLTNLEALSVSGAVLDLADIFTRYEVDDNTHYIANGRTATERNLFISGDGTSAQNGRETKFIDFLWVSDLALNYWISTYEGKRVTFKTTLRQFNNYTRYNVAVGQIQYQEPQYLQGTWWYQDVRVPLYIKGTAT